MNAEPYEFAVDAWLQMLLVDNLVHSDLHPGNILVRLDPPRGSRTLAHFLTHRLGLEVRGSPLGLLLRAMRVVGLSAHFFSHALGLEVPGRLSMRAEGLRLLG